MASTLTELRSLVYIALGRSDSDAVTVVDAAINYMATVAALLNKPAELEKKANLTVGAGTFTSSLSSLTRYLNLVRIYNETDAHRMGPVPFELWDILPASNKTQYYSTYGSNLYVKGTPAVDKVLNVYYIGYPSNLVNATDALEFDHHDSFIVSGATALAFAFFEEGETTAMWMQILQGLLTPYQLGRQEREIIQGELMKMESSLAQQAQGAKQ